MRTRLVCVAALLCVLTACAGESGDGGSADERRTKTITALRSINPALVADEDQALARVRAQCAVVDRDGADEAAKERFSTDGHQVSDTEASTINDMLRLTLCE
ncbi:hypothetical protein AB0M28_24780 [Streptomyces sp. NPDC051940]|uniref:hypothetical protein n=1 Tax=Streptomyces sp. NPDC051940 TaxID=3155675 RepID=UPI003435D032